MNKLCSIIFCVLAATFSVCDAVSPEVNAIRSDAVQTLSRTLPDTFVSRDTFMAAMEFIQKELDPAVHQKLLELQAEADELNNIRTQMLAIPGVTAESQAVKSIDAMLNEIAKKLNDLIYNDGVLSWRTLLSVGAGLNYGLYSGATFKGKENSASTFRKVWHGLWVGFVVALILEFSLRGRKAVIAGTAYGMVKFVFEVIRNFFGFMFGTSGCTDKWLGSVENSLRKTGSRLDRCLNNKWGASAIGLLTIGAAALIYKKCIQISPEGTQEKQAH